MLYDIGEKPGKGTYRCTTCEEWTVTLDDDDDRLPPCGVCPAGTRVKYRENRLTTLSRALVEGLAHINRKGPMICQSKEPRQAVDA